MIKSYQKIKAVRDKRYLEFIKTKLCYICNFRYRGYEQIIYAHQTLRELKDISAKGVSKKDHDNWCLPEHSIEHIEWEHGQGNRIDDRLQRVFHLNIEYLIKNNPEFYEKIKLYSKVRESITQNMIDVLKYITLNWR